MQGPRQGVEGGAVGPPRVHADGEGQLVGEGHGAQLGPARGVARRQHSYPYACRSGPGQHVGSIEVEQRVVEMAVGVDPWGT